MVHRVKSRGHGAEVFGIGNEVGRSWKAESSKLKP